MKFIALTFLLFFFSVCAQAQGSIEVGDAQANAGIGLDGDGTPIYAGVDYSIVQDVTIGAVAGFAKNYSSIGANVNYHFDELINLPFFWNIYGGANLGYYFDNDGNTNDVDGFGLGAQIGARYFFSDQWAVNLEVGGGNQVSGGKLGATFRF